MSGALLPLRDNAPWQNTPWQKLATAADSQPSREQGRIAVPPQALSRLAETAFFEINHFLRPDHLRQLAAIVSDTDASPNDRFVAFELLKNANVAAGGVLPMCQDTGTAIVHAWRGNNVATRTDDEAEITAGIRGAYEKHNLRYSQLAPLSMFREKNTRTNLPAEIEILAENIPPAADEYRFLFVAKGGGSANKSYFFQLTPSMLRPDKLIPFLQEKIIAIGTAACPPYHLAVVIGGPSAEFCLRTVKLASTHFLDGLPETGDESGHGFRDREMEDNLLQLTRDNGIGAQFGGKYFCHDVRVVRLPRHGASLPVGIGVSCSADRQALARITADGLFLEQLEHDPARFLPENIQSLAGGGTGGTGGEDDEVVSIDLSQPMDKIRAELSRHPVRTRLALNGPLTVARDAVHLRLQQNLEDGKPLPDYFKRSPIYYAGPAKQPEGLVSGSFGPTTAGRMDSYVAAFQAAGGSLVMLAKGNRGAQVREACKKYGGFHLGSIGGPAAQLARENIRAVRVLDYEDLGMEAVWQIEVENFPAFIVIDDKGNDFFKELRIS